MENMRLMSVVLLMSLLAVCAYGTECPPQEEMPKGCACRDWSWLYPRGIVVVGCSGSRQDALKIEEIASVLREKFPANTSEIDTLSIKDFGGQNALTSGIFDGLRVRVLIIKNCRFERWADEVGGPAFVGLEDSLKELHILSSIFVNEEYTFQPEIPAPFSLRHLRQLTKVKIFKNKLLVFGNDWFGNGGSSVDELDIEQNGIYAIGEEAFVGLKNMRNFKAEQNHIRELKRSMFPEDSKLVLLDVRNNYLEEFSEDFFVNFPSLNKIELNGNPIKFVPENVFGEIWPQLNYIDFKQTRLHCDDHIDWMLDVKEPTNLLGWCRSPEELAGKTLHFVLYLRRNSRFDV